MKVYTSYYDNIDNLPDNVVPISIAGRCPEWYFGLEFKSLAPKIGFFKEWKKNHDNNFYIEHFNKEVLNLLDANDVMFKLHKLSKGQDIVLLCYEEPGLFCHRHLVAEWLCKNGYYVEEYREVA